MAGPHSPYPGVGTDGPTPYPDQGLHQPAALEYPQDPALGAPTYPGPMPPQVADPNRRRRRVIVSALVILALVAALTVAIAYGVRSNRADTAGPFSKGSARTAIQEYLNALEHRDVDAIVRNALCGIYDGVRDKRSDQALAKLSSDAFRKQFSKAEVTSVDQVVYWSQYQAQVLFTMQVTPAVGGPPKGQVQGIAQLLYQRGRIMVCSYVLRTAGHY
ncbi:hypothetical protein [Mycobacterium spongiae]|uniref:DUF8174 domain-containing protein n=1 Tax=Mycobacterium spongiae TaxID=886343 RepID=A0A975JYG0_9MYCO|nr:hypothetical protein [Mycobacterium spongiae]QUR68002.1 hypothetical protein F6B93_13655 [Mycobacterium spongiae]